VRRRDGGATDLIAIGAAAAAQAAACRVSFARLVHGGREKTARLIKARGFRAIRRRRDRRPSQILLRFDPGPLQPMGAAWRTEFVREDLRSSLRQ
jgi:hypothetical protein